MKTKKLTIALLILAIVTTLSAGTLAIYTTQIESVESTNVSAKVFALTLNQSETQTIALKMAPGESVQSEDFILSNTTKAGAISEVDMDLLINLCDSHTRMVEFFQTFNNATIELLHKEGDQYVSAWSWSEKDLPAMQAGDADYEVSNGLAMMYDENGQPVANRQTYAFRVNWIDSSDEGDIETQTQRGNDASGGSFKIYVKATQHVEKAAAESEA